MDKRTDPATWRTSRFSALAYGVMIDDVLPSKGVNRCVYADRCPWVFRSRCAAGSRCGHESYIFDKYISSATTHYAYAKAWMTEAEFDRTVRDLAVISLQSARLASRIATEWPFDQESGVNGVSRPAVGIAITRYATALHRKRQLLTRRLLDQETDEYWATV
jgi:hypothetical protein